jgi:hypothetical protein
VLALFMPTLRCVEGCHLDYEAIREGLLGRLEPADARLNTWILGWVQRSLLQDPAGLWDANTFYPALRTLTQSEHMLAQAVTLLPVRALGGDPVAVHQAGIVFSALALALTTFALLRGFGASAFAAAAGGAAAVAMPWRLAEVSHVQLLSAQWFPLVWLLALRVAQHPSRIGYAVGLALALALQLLSSFYLAYYLAASFALLVLAAWWCGALAPRGLAALAAALALPALLLVLTALPYLEWRESVGFLGPRPIESVTPGEALALMAPRFEFGWRGRLPLPVSFEVPLAVCIFAALGAWAAWRAGDDEGGRSLRALALGLLTLIGVALVLSLGRELALGGLRVPLPGELAARLVPGYEQLRNPLRWAIPIAIAVPVLAGLGIAWLERRIRGNAARVLLRAGVVLLWAVNLPWAVLPVRDAWERSRAHLAAYRALDALAPGAVLELPMPLGSTVGVDVESRYVLASTLHWRGLVNGLSGYVPPSYLLLQQIAQDLPDPRALARLHALTDVRFLVLHVDALSPLVRAPWEQAVRRGRLTRVWSDDASWILELPGFERAGRLQAALVSHEPRPLTLTGLPRAPLALVPGEAAVEIAGPLTFHSSHGNPVLRRLPVTLRNASALPWPGLDVQPEGLVRLRFAFLDDGGRVVTQQSVALADDVPARRALALRLPVMPPGEVGRFRLRAELVQVQDGSERVLEPVAPAELAVLVDPVDFQAGTQGAGALR